MSKRSAVRTVDVEPDALDDRLQTGDGCNATEEHLIVVDGRHVVVRPAFGGVDEPAHPDATGLPRQTRLHRKVPARAGHKRQKIAGHFHRPTVALRDEADLTMIIIMLSLDGW